MVQDKKVPNLFPAQRVACREVTMASGHGRADNYLLYLDQRVVGVIEAKPQGTTLSGVEWRSAMYAEGLPLRHTPQGPHDERTPRSRASSSPLPHSTSTDAVHTERRVVDEVGIDYHCAATHTVPPLTAGIALVRCATGDERGDLEAVKPGRQRPAPAAESTQ